MPRNGEDARKRLMIAALDLFTEHGFDQTTAAQIAARAGVTERTFFRHFPDKRDVLFDGQAALTAAISDSIERLPLRLSPMQTLRQAFSAIVGPLEQNRRVSEPRQHIVAATPALQEREVAKHTALIQVIAEALRQRGIEARRADLAAQAGMAVLSHALRSWFADPALGLADHLNHAFTELQDLSSAE
jgi:AcrR family transcriptional regulator